MGADDRTPHAEADTQWRALVESEAALKAEVALGEMRKRVRAREERERGSEGAMVKAVLGRDCEALWLTDRASYLYETDKEGESHATESGLRLASARSCRMQRRAGRRRAGGTRRRRLGGRRRRLSSRRRSSGFARALSRSRPTSPFQPPQALCPPRALRALRRWRATGSRVTRGEARGEGSRSRCSETRM